MKNFYTLFLALIFTGSLMAQTPLSFKYQAVARDASGEVVANQAVGIQISILQGSTSGTAVYVETFTPTTNEFGLMNLNIGAGTMVSGDLTTIDWSSDTYFVKVEMDITGGTTYEEYGTSQLLSVPYALHAKTAENLTGTVTETDPLFTAWDKTTGISITESQISDLNHFTNADETDQIFTASVANNITASDTTRWGSTVGTEVDPLFIAWDKSAGISITESQISDLNHFTPSDETDPVFVAHAANGISSTNITNWTTAFGWGDHSVAGYTTTDTTLNETEVDNFIANNGYLTSYTETDPVFSNLFSIISPADNQLLKYNSGTSKWENWTANFLTTEVDGDVTNEIQNLSEVLTEDNSANARIKNVTDPVDNQDAATKAYVDVLLEKIEYLESLSGVEEPVTDYDGNTYNTQRIGDQVWMAENLKTTHFENGDEIPDGTGAGDIAGETDPKYWFAYDNDLNNVSTYGRLYTWYTVTDSRKVCPDGWHAPSDAEWTQLSDYLGGSSVAGGKMKETSTTHWNSSNTGATNETGFTALPGGYRSYDGTFDFIGYSGYWWSSTEDSATDA